MTDAFATRSPDTGVAREAAPATGVSCLEARGITVGYGDTPVLSRLDVAIPTGGLTVIVGPNACGKSTLLKALARMLPAKEGTVLLDGVPITKLRPRHIARSLGLLPQSPVAPDGIVVADLVARGRYPHQGFLQQWTAQDTEAVSEAMARSGVDALATRQVSDLSGGQRQRVWIALALAQKAPILLLDEPTTYLDIAHQIEVLRLTRDLHRDGYTVVMVLHDLQLAFRYATHLIVMRGGRILAEGRPADIVTADLIEEAFGLPCRILSDPESGTPLVIPLADPSAH